jgi:hypothetical protein
MRLARENVGYPTGDMWDGVGYPTKLSDVPIKGRWACEWDIPLVLHVQTCGISHSPIHALNHMKSVGYPIPWYAAIKGYPIYLMHCLHGISHLVTCQSMWDIPFVHACLPAWGIDHEVKSVGYPIPLPRSHQGISHLFTNQSIGDIPVVHCLSLRDIPLPGRGIHCRHVNGISLHCLYGISHQMLILHCHLSLWDIPWVGGTPLKVKGISLIVGLGPY